MKGMKANKYDIESTDYYKRHPKGHYDDADDR